MKEYLNEAREELKRADHILYVSLKYTRTVDMIRHMIERLISTFDFLVDYILEDLKKKKKINEIPPNIAIKCELIKKKNNDETIRELVDFYLYLRRLIRAKYTREREYRKHVTMISNLDNTIINIKIESMYEYFKKTKDYVDYLQNLSERK